MTHEEIAELFIHAAEVDRRLPDTARPARLKAQALPYVHDHVDQAGWGGLALYDGGGNEFGLGQPVDRLLSQRAIDPGLQIKGQQLPNGRRGFGDEIHYANL